MPKSYPVDTAQQPRKSGMFYPRGYVIVAFKSEDDASRARQQLIDGGYDEEDAQLMDTKRVLEGSTSIWST